MPTLADLRAKYPDAASLNDNELIDIAAKQYDTTPEIFKDAIGYKPPSSGIVANAGRGVKEAFQQIPQLGYGLMAGAGATAEAAFGEGGIATGIKKAGVKGYQAYEDKMQKDALPSDSFTYSYDKAKEGDFGAMVDWFTHGIGYAGGQAAQMLATAGLGSVIGKAGLKATVEKLASGMVSKEAAALAATEEGAKLSADQLAKAATTNVAGRIGAATATGASAYGMEGGEIGGGIAKKSVDENRALTGEEIAKALGATFLAGTAEFGERMLGLEALKGKLAISKKLGEMPGIKGKLTRAGTSSLVAAPIEGLTEYGQTGIEEYGKGNEANMLTWNQSESTQGNALDAAAQGMLGGVLHSSAGGILSSPQKAPITNIADIGKAATVDDAIKAADNSVLSAQAVTNFMGAVKAGTPIRDQQSAQAYGGETGLLSAYPDISTLPKVGTEKAYELNDLVTREGRDLETLRAELQREFSNDRELNDLQAQGRALEAAKIAELPTAMQLAMQKATTKPNIEGNTDVITSTKTLAPAAEQSTPERGAERQVNSEQPTAQPVAESQAPAFSDSGDGGVAPAQAGSGPIENWDGLDASDRADIIRRSGMATKGGDITPAGRKLLEKKWATIPISTRAKINQSLAEIQAEREAHDPEHLGIDSTPLREGGKPYKLKKSADIAKKQQPMMRVVKVAGGFALAPKTEKQLAAQEKASRRLSLATTGQAGTPIAAHEFIAGEGMLHPSTRVDMGMEGNIRIGNRSLFAGAGRGLTIEKATERLIEAGYLNEVDSHEEARNLIKQSLKSPRYTPQDTELMAEREAEQRFADYLAAEQEAAQDEDYDPFESVAELGYTLDDAEIAGYDSSNDAIKIEVNALLAQAEAIGIDTDTIKEQSYENTRNGSEQDYNESARDALKAAIEGGRGHRSQDASQQSDANGQEGLTSPTRADILKQQADAEAEARRKEDGGDKPLPRRELTGDVPDMFNTQGSVFDTPAAQATEILDAANVAGKERIDVLKDVKSGDITPNELKAAYPAKEENPSNIEGSGQVANETAPEQGMKIADGPMFSRTSIPFYSALSKGIETINAKSQSGQAWIQNIIGLVNKGSGKADEVEWSGLNDWLKLQEGKVTKEQVTAYLDTNGVQVTEAILSGKLTGESLDRALESADLLGYDTLSRARAEYLRAPQNYDIGDAETGSASKYSQYQLPGGKNYREVLLTLPGKTAIVESIEGTKRWRVGDQEFYSREDAERTAKTDARNSGYRSSHWDQPNVLAHIRLNDRVDDDGNKVLFVEEVQSDWGQDGKKKGFDTGGQNMPEVLARAEYESAGVGSSNWRWSLPDGSGGIQPSREAAERAAADALNNRERVGVLNAPFVTNTDKWLNLALKRIIKMAVDEGYDKVAFVNGEQSADRYDLSKQISDIHYTKETNGKYYIVVGGPNGGVHSGEHTASGLEDYVGKELAQKIVDRADDSMKELSGLDLKVGGEGMKKFYDAIVPNATKALIKKLGGEQLESVLLPQGTQSAMTGEWSGGELTQTGFTITDKMRELASNGLPLFNRDKNTIFEPVKTKTGTAFKSDDIALAAPKVNPNQPDNGLQRVDFEIRDRHLFSQAIQAGKTRAQAVEASHIGMLTMDMDGDQFKGLRNIQIFNRGNGYGENVIKAIMGSVSGKLYIHDILPTAVDFWDKMGAKFPRSEDFMSANLSPEQFRRSYDTRTRTEGARNQSQKSGATSYARGKESGLGVHGKSVPRGLSQTQFNQALTKAFGAKVADKLVAKGVVVPLANQSNLPNHIVPFLRDNDIVYGFYDPKTDKTYAVLSNLTEDMVKGLVLHEVGVHYGFERMLGKKSYDSVIKRMDVMRRAGNKAVQSAFDEAEKNSVRPSQIPEETLAYLVQNHPEMTLVKQLIAKIKAFLFNEFGIGGKYLTNDDITMLAYAAISHSSKTMNGGVVPSFMKQGKSADETTPGAAFDAQAAFEKHGGTGDIDESTDITAKSEAFADMAESEGYKVAGRGDKYVTITQSFGKTADGYDKDVIINVRISDHSNVNRGYNFGESAINIAPDDGYSRDTFADALKKIKSAYVNDDLDTIIPNEPTAPESDGTKPDIHFSRSSIVGQTSRKHTPEQLKAMKNVGFDVIQPTLKERAKLLWKDAGKKMAQGIVDQFAPVKDLDKKAYGLMRLAKGASGAFEAFLQGGKLKLTDGVYDFDQANKGGVVDKLLIPLQGEHHDFMRWVAANRAERLMGDGKENLFTKEDIAALKTLSEGTTDFDYTIQTGPKEGQVTRGRSLIYGDALRVFNGFNKNILDMAEQSGLIDPESRKYWEHEFYVPFYRVADEGGVRGMNIKGSVVRQEAFKSLKGGKGALNADLLDNTLMNWAHLLDAAAKNRAAKATIEAAEAVGVAMGGNQSTLAEMASSVHNKQGVVWFMDGGQKRYSLIDQEDGPYLLTALTSLEYAGMRNPVMNAMSAMKHALTIGVTASPFFKVRNLIRDSVQAIGTGNLSYNPAKNIAEGWKLTDPKSDAYFRLLAGGGTIHFGTMMEGSEAKRIQALVESGVDASTILNNDHKVKAFYRKFIEPLRTAYSELGNRGEAINRASLYDQLVKQGMNHAEASLQARDLMDFSMQGSFATIRFLTQVVPFFNARLQGLYKLGKSAKEDPKRFGIVLGATAVLSIGLLAAYGDDDDWKKREESDRNNFWWFKFGGTAFRIPKPFEIGAIATLAERGFELAFDKEMTNKRFLNQVLTLLGDNLSMNPVPQLIKPVVDIYANKDSFTGRPIETMGQENLRPEYRFNDRTSMVARGLSTSLNAATGIVGKESLSPVQIDHMLRGYFGWLGSFVVGASDIVARPATGQAEHASADMWKVATGNMVSDLRDAPSRYVTQMYTQAKEIEQSYGTYRDLVKQGKFQEATEFKESHNDDLIKYKYVEQVKRAEAKLNERIRYIERSNIEPDAKRDLIRTIQMQKNKAAESLSKHAA